MESSHTLRRVRELGLLAVVRGESRAAAIDVVGALVEGGVLGIEVTFITPEAPEVIRELSEEYGESIVLGAGTATSREHIEQSIEAGAAFLVSPGCDPDLLPAMLETGLLTVFEARKPPSLEEGMNRLHVPPWSEFRGIMRGAWREPTHRSLTTECCRFRRVGRRVKHLPASLERASRVRKPSTRTPTKTKSATLFLRRVAAGQTETPSINARGEDVSLPETGSEPRRNENPAALADGSVKLPGTLTPSEIMLARRLGAPAVKLFPGSSGGPSYLKALRGPFPDITFMPTGGVSLENVAEWFAAGAFAVGAGGSLAPPSLEGRDRGEVVENARRFAEAARAAGEG